MNRRDFVKLIGATGLSLAGQTTVLAQVAPPADKAKAPNPSDKPAHATAQSVIQLWMGGGPCHLDTWDPKPNAGPAYRGPYAKAIPTNVDGIQISPMLPKMAKQIDKCALLRGMTHNSNAHEIGAYMMQTGTMPSTDLVYPSVGAVVAFKRSESGRYRGALPPYIAVTQPLGRFSEAGFLGSAYKMFATGGNPNSSNFSIGGLNVANQAARIQQRRDLVAAFDGLARSLGDDPQWKQVDQYQQRAYELILGDAKEAFELNREPDKMRDRYGRTTFGQSCLLARRLVEKGVPFVTVNWPGWDTHSRHFERMAKMLPELDQGFSALLEDLAQRGLLSTTIVTWFGEFGRTPKIANQPPWNGGRHHYGKAFSAVVAGGGFQGGKVVGETDPRGEKVI
ncbi:MAG: DUF1501 domain-containing protein, partial [Thermoguttaceae bacterium]